MTGAVSQISASLLIAACCAAGAAPSASKPVQATVATTPAAIPTQFVKLAGLKQPVEILLDRWGVAHIYAANQDDVFFAQGYNAARDRLFQIDLWRRRGLGRLASVFGAAFVEQDKAARLFLYRGDMQKEWNAYGGRAQAIAESFVAGINAYIDQLVREPQRLPLEFRSFGYAPEKWQAEDVVRIRSHALTRNLYSEVARAHSACQGDLKIDEIRVSLSPPWQTRLPAGLDPCLPGDLLQVFQLATQGVTLSKAPGQAALGSPSMLAQGASGEIAPPMEGSNAWVIAPAKSSTSRPILASDPHRAYGVPSLRYITHLSAPQLDVIGAGEPALPGISIGHNGTIAFGLTIFAIDQEDLYVYELNPANPSEYRYQGQWEKFTIVNERIMVKGAEPVNAELKFTRHGPLIYTERAKNRAFAVRSGWFVPGMAPYFGSINYLFARNFQEFRQTLLHWGAPAVNQVYADVMGNIGWVSGGLAPIRPNWDGLLPVPGDGRFEWAGFLAGDKLPSSYNPQQGWFASANEMNLPPDYPYREHKLGFEWPSSDRYQRLSAVLSRPGKRSLEDAMRLQNDLVSVPARRLVGLLKSLDSSDNRTQAALKLLRGWNFVESADSAPAALFEVWWSRYLAYVFKQGALSKAAAATLGSVDSAYLLNALEKPQTAFGSDAVARRDWVLLTSLTLAWMDLQKLLGADPKQWQWGKLQQVMIEHPFAAAVDAATRAKLNVGPMPKHGGAHTPNMSSYDPRNFRLNSGPSFRVVLDVGNWDNSRAINTPGQSGDPDSPHYRDLAPLWLRGDYFPLLYSKKRIVAATVERIELRPE